MFEFQILDTKLQLYLLADSPLVSKSSESKVAMCSLIVLEYGEFR